MFRKGGTACESPSSLVELLLEDGVVACGSHRPRPNLGDPSFLRVVLSSILPNGEQYIFSIQLESLWEGDEGHLGSPWGI